jgi:hypothetical protein
MGQLGCSKLVDIELTIDNSSDAMVWVLAGYHYSIPVSSHCAAPDWTSDRQEMVVDKSNPFRAGFNRTAGGTATLFATGPNGVQSKITLDINGPSNSVRGLPGTCTNVTGVSVDLRPASGLANVLVASYTYDGPVSTPCLTAPVWAADRRGLNVNPKNLFEASIDRSDAATTVTATAPNGIAGSTRF